MSVRLYSCSFWTYTFELPLQVIEYVSDWREAFKSVADDFAWLTTIGAPAAEPSATKTADVAVAEIVEK